MFHWHIHVISEEQFNYLSFTRLHGFLKGRTWEQSLNKRGQGHELLWCPTEDLPVWLPQDFFLRGFVVLSIAVPVTG